MPVVAIWVMKMFKESEEGTYPEGGALLLFGFSQLMTCEN